MPSPNLLNPANDPIVEARLRRGLLNFGTALATGGPGVPGDIGQMASSGVTGLLNARMNSIDPTGRVRGMAGQHGLLSAPEVPFSSEAMQKKLGGDPRAPESLLGFMGAPDVTDVGKIVSAAAAKGLLDPSLAHTLFHGTPHRFDKFELEKIGTGEGAQAYGHGLYFAESPDVAKNYVPRDFDAEEVMMKRYKAAEAVEDYETMEIWERAMMHDTSDEIRDVYKGADYDDAFRAKAESVAAELEQLERQSQSGHLYEVDIPDEITAKMLDWDAPLSEQPELKRFADEVYGYKPGNKELDSILENDPLGLLSGDAPDYAASRTGQELYQALSQKLGGDEAASRALNEAGIPGIRFYDGNSRNSKVIVSDKSLHRLAGGVAENYLEAANNNVDTAINRLMNDYDASGAKQYLDAANGLKEGTIKPSATRNIVVFNPDDITHVKRDGELVYKTKGL